MTYKAKKGDVIAIERVHSCHSIGMKRTEWRDWTLGRVARASRSGAVDQFTIGDSSLVWSVDRNVRIATISDPEKRAAAERVLAIRGNAPFDTIDDIRAEILCA